MREIEAKFKLAAGVTFDDVMTKLRQKYAIDSPPKRQVDAVYFMPDHIGRETREGDKVMRVRTITVEGQEPISLMTLKVRTALIMAADEYEFRVSDSLVADAMIEALGFVPVVTVDKKRIETKLDEYTACIDQVEGLGVFIELETLVDDDNVDAAIVQSAMHNYLSSLGLDGEVNMVPYDIQLMAKSEKS